MNARSTSESVDQPGFAQSLGALWLLTWRGFLVWRRAPVWLATLLAMPLLAWITIPRGATVVFLDWAAQLFLGLLVPLYCLVMCGGMIRDEIQDDTLAFLVTRPLTRARLYLGKYICLLAWLELAVLLNGGLLAGVGWLKGVAVEPALVGRMLLAGALAVLVYGALGSLFGLLTRRYIVLGLVYGFLVEVGIGHIPTNINSLSMLRHIQTLLAGSAAVSEQYDWSPDGAWTSILIMVIASVVALGAGAVLFTHKEFLGNRETES